MPEQERQRRERERNATGLTRTSWLTPRAHEARRHMQHAGTCSTLCSAALLRFLPCP